MVEVLMKCGAVFAVVVAIWYVKNTNNDGRLVDTGTVIGIDMGAAYMSVGVYNKKSVHIIPNDQGGARTPAVISFFDDGVIYIGDEALNKAITNPKNTIHSVYNLLGKPWKDKAVKNFDNSNTIGFTLVNVNEKPYILVKVDGDKKLFSPEEICAMLLGHMKDLAEQYLGERIQRAVLTVPAYLSDHQRRSVRNAGKIAGLEVTRMLNAPTARAIALSFDIVKEIELDREKYEKAGYTYDQDDVNIIVFDFGASHLDVSVLTVVEGMVQSVATQGDDTISGDAINLNLVNYFLKVHKRKTGGKDVIIDDVAMAKLNREVERVKRSLSTHEVARLEIESFHKGADLAVTLNRGDFEDMNMDILRAALRPLKQVMKLSQMLPSMIDQVILNGGSSRIPMFEHSIKGFFKHTVPIVSVDKEMSATLGAAIQGGVLMSAAGVENRVTVDINSHSLGFKTMHGNISLMIPRFTSLPKNTVVNFTTSEDYQTSMAVEIYEGESNDTSESTLWGLCQVRGLGAYLGGFPQIEVTIGIDERGLFQFEAEAKSVVMERLIIIPAVKGMSKTDIQRSSEKVKDIILGVAKHLKKRKYEEMLEMNLFCFNFVLNTKHTLDQSEKERLKGRLDEINEWLKADTNKLAYELADKLAEFDALRNHLKLFDCCLK